MQFKYKIGTFFWLIIFFMYNSFCSFSLQVLNNYYENQKYYLEWSKFLPIRRVITGNWFHWNLNINLGPNLSQYAKISLVHIFKNNYKNNYKYKFIEKS